MPNLADQITKIQVETALEYIENNNIQLTASTVYDMVYKEKRYPPKDVVRWAAKLANIPGWKGMKLNGGPNTNDPLKNMGYQIEQKEMTKTPQELLILNYKKRIRATGNEQEVYKWSLISKYEGRPDLNSSDFGREMQDIKYLNLVYPMGIGVKNHIAKDAPEAYRAAFKKMFDESIDLKFRIETFQDEISSIYKSLGVIDQPHHHDERTIATFLAFSKPHKYALYKNTFYSKYCKLLGISQEKKNNKYVHYLTLINDLVNNYIKNDEELQNLKRNFIPEGGYSDDNNLILAQDILYQMLDKATEEVEIGEELNDKGIETAKTEGNHPLNQILYGPPGTGKTYHTINKALEIVAPDLYAHIISADEPEENKRERLTTEFKKLLIKDWDNVSEGQIAFITFHQSMSYEDFIEGIKPYTVSDGIRYRIEDGIFKKLSSRASEKQTVLKFDEAYALFLEEVVGKGYIILETPIQKKKFKVRINSNETAVAIPETEKATEMGVTKEMIKTYLLTGEIKDWKPYTTSIGTYIQSKYKVTVNEVDNQAKNYVLIIDEINRGNVASIFGDLITLIEPSKRAGAKEELELILPYSKTKFSVPSNLYIVGTMNTADRSVEALDTALRRRFHFEEKMPDYECLRDFDSAAKRVVKLHYDYDAIPWDKWAADYREMALAFYHEIGLDIEIGGVDEKALYDVITRNEFNIDNADAYLSSYNFNPFLNLRNLLTTINKRIEVLYDREHQIGHSYFITVQNAQFPITELRRVFKNEIIPLLQEYFFGDYEKIGLVLGNGFISKVEEQKNVFALFSDANASDYYKPLYSIREAPLASDLMFIQALKQLMNYKVLKLENAN